MRGFLAVAQREVVERWTWLAAAAVVGLLPLAVPVLPWVGAGNTTDARSTMALILAATLVSAGALGLGSSMIARDLSERRLGFYFARPLGAAAIWWGKLVASFLVLSLAGMLVLLPAAVLGGSSALGEPLGLGSDGGSLLAWAAVTILLLVGLAHALAVAGRSHLPLLALDLAAAATFGTVIWSTTRRLLFADPWKLYPGSLVATTAAVLVALLLAGWVQVAIGRCDVRRGHRALSATLWGILASFALGLVGFAAWVYSVTPASLAALWEVLPARQGAWMLVSGSSTGRGYFAPTFLVDAENGRWVRVQRAGRWWHHCQFSTDGRHAVWMTPVGLDRSDPLQIYAVDLSTTNPKPLATTLIVNPSEARMLRLSPDGSLLAILGDTTLSVYSLPEGTQVRSVRLESGSRRVTMRFVHPRELAIGMWEETAQRTWWNPVAVTLWRLDIPSGKLERTGTLSGVAPRDAWVMPDDPRGELMLATHTERDSGELVLHDAGSGLVLARLMSWPYLPLMRAGFLADGRIVVAESRVRKGQAALLHVFGRDGKEQRTIEMDLGMVKVLGGEVAPGVLAVGFGPGMDESDRGGRTLLVDLDQASVRRLPEGYLPSPGYDWWSGSGQVAMQPGGPATRLFRTPEGALALYDPVADRFRTVLDTRWED